MGRYAPYLHAPFPPVQLVGYRLGIEKAPLRLSQHRFPSKLSYRSARVNFDCGKDSADCIAEMAHHPGRMSTISSRSSPAPLLLHQQDLRLPQPLHRYRSVATQVSTRGIFPSRYVVQMHKNYLVCFSGRDPCQPVRRKAIHAQLQIMNMEITLAVQSPASIWGFLLICTN